ncbi:MAG TPA: YdeI/OmpD-associated family protein [Dermatophilaceae bacterium]|nr:YdeI/OmpD-associated family protein [Dermatophilaceae bacterium]
MPSELPDLLVRDAAAWRAWLGEHESESDGVWLRLAKKGVTEPTSLTYPEALDEALCSGWVDGQVKSLDATTFRQRFTPRRSRSLWSARNVDNVARLTAAGRMRPRGLAEVDRAKADGRWAVAYAGPATVEVPPELAGALAGNAVAAATFDRLSGQNRYAILHRLATLKTAAAKERNVAKFVVMLERGETIYPQ